MCRTDLKKNNPIICCVQEIHFNDTGTLKIRQ